MHGQLYREPPVPRAASAKSRQCRVLTLAWVVIPWVVILWLVVVILWAVI